MVDVASEPVVAVPVPDRQLPRPPGALLVVAMAVGIVFAAPLAYLVVRNAGSATEFLRVVASEDALGPLRRTLQLAVTVAAASAVLGTALAWFTTRTDLPARRLWRVLLVLPLVVPSFVGALALLAGFAPGGLLHDALDVVGVELERPEGFWPLFVVLTLFTYPYVFLPASARLATLPASLEESARVLGRGSMEVFRTVVVPQVSGSIAAGSLLVFLYVVSDFGAPALLRYDTLATRIYSTRLADRPTSLALSLLLAIVALAVIVLERAVARRRARRDVVADGGRPLVSCLRRARAPVLGFVLGVLALALVAPVAVLTQWAWRALHGTRAVSSTLDAGDLSSAAWSTAWIAVVAAAVAVGVVLPVAWVTVRHRSTLGSASYGLVVVGFALPGIVIALALVFWAVRAPVLRAFYLTLPLLVFAYLVHFGAQALRASQEAVSAVPRRLPEAARTLGASRMRRFVTVELPLMRPGLLAGAGLVLLSVAKELPATLVLHPTGFETLSLRIWAATERLAYGEAAIAALVLLAISGVLTWLLTIRPGDLRDGRPG